MKKEELDRLIKISAYSAVIITILLLIISSSPIQEVSVILRSLTTSVTIVVFFWGAYFKWFWKYPGIKNILYRPNISGTWKGSLVSDYLDKEGKPTKKMFFIVIRQNFLDTSITTFTDNFMGVSYSENLLLNDTRGEKKLVYLYRKDIADIGVQEYNEGACILGINERLPMKMQGRYWSNIKTKGMIEVIKICDDCISSFQEGSTLTEE